MRKIKIVADTSCDLFCVKKAELSCAPMKIITAEREFIDDDGLDSEGYASGKISIGHCKNESAAAQLRELILAKYPSAAVEIHALRGLCSFYAEKGGVLVGFEKI